MKSLYQRIDERYISERKDHFIKKNPNLTPSQKDYLIKYFNLHNEKESLVDWNNNNNLYWEDFEYLFDKYPTDMLKVFDIKKFREIPGAIIYYNSIDNEQAIVGLGSVEAAKFVAMGGNNKWCLKSERFTQEYFDKGELFIMVFNWKNSYPLKKVIIEIKKKPELFFELHDQDDNIIFETINTDRLNTYIRLNLGILYSLKWKS